jgi:hypothetical protein
VDLRSPLVQAELAGDALHGVRGLVTVEDAVASTGASTPLRPGASTGKRTGLPDVARIGIGVVLLLMLFGAELRLRLGLRFDMIVTLAGIWAFWRFCLRPRGSVA